MPAEGRGVPTRSTLNATRLSATTVGRIPDAQARRRPGVPRTVPCGIGSQPAEAASASPHRRPVATLRNSINLGLDLESTRRPSSDRTSAVRTRTTLRRFGSSDAGVDLPRVPRQGRQRGVQRERVDGGTATLGSGSRTSHRLTTPRTSRFAAMSGQRCSGRGRACRRIRALSEA